MKHYEHKIVDADEFFRLAALPHTEANPPYGKFGWRVVGTTTNTFGSKVILERER